MSRKKGFKLSPTTKKLMSEAKLGRKFTSKHKAAMSAAQKGIKSANCKVVIIDGVEYFSMKEAAKQIGVLYVTVHARMKNKSFPNYQYKVKQA